jgi:hypothetical protein
LKGGADQFFLVFRNDVDGLGAGSSRQLFPDGVANFRQIAKKFVEL